TTAAYLFGSNSFNDLSIANCTSLNVEGGSVQTFSSFTYPEGTGCNDYFQISSTIQGSPASFICTAGVIGKNWLQITDVTAGGGATFNAFNSIGVGNVTGWNITAVAGVTLYWFGDAGVWNDAAHWSLTSGGPVSYGCVPSSEDIVVFDDQSFTTSGQTVDIDADAYCKDMIWTGVTNNPELTGWQDIYINGSLTLDPNMIASYSGMFLFGASDAGNTILSAGKTLGGITFNGTGEYDLQDDLTINWSGILFNSGTLNTNDFVINCAQGDFRSNSSSPRELNLGASTIDVSSWVVSDNTNFSLNPGTSVIRLGSNAWEFNGGDLTYNDVYLVDLNWGGLTVKGSNTFNLLNIEEGAEIAFEEGTTQTTTMLQAEGSDEAHIFLGSTLAGSTAYLNQTAQEFCGDWLEIQDMTASGTTFYAGINSVDNGNNSGWTWSGVTAINQYPAAMCEDVPGGGTVAGIDLTALEASIDGGNTYTHTWYEDAFLTVPVGDPTNVAVSDLQVFYDAVDNGVCINTAEVTYSVVSSPVLSFVITDASCNGNADGDIDMTVASDYSPCTYAWDTGAGTEDISGLLAGTYDVTVTDIEGCQNTGSATVGEPALLSPSISGTDPLCNGDSNGEADLSVSGGTSPYSYLWDTGATTEDITGLSAGTYSVVVTDANGCTSNASITLTDPAVLTASISGTDPLCNGSSDGEADLTVSGGTASYTYLWDGGEISEDLTNIPAGTYTVYVSDANGCTSNASITLTEPTALTA
ncbi:MAG: hypothetical protein C0594_01940, partial [Marinilabiliales bacterium]